MPKRRRLCPPSTEKHKDKGAIKEEFNDGEVWTARGRLKGALKEVLDPTDDSSPVENSPVKRLNRVRRELNSELGEDLVILKRKGKNSNIYLTTADSQPRQPFVMKLFDRNVDLSQFCENTPLYPICRAWIANQPKANYSALCKIEKKEEEDGDEDGVELAPPEGPPVSRIPALLPIQRLASRDTVNAQLMSNNVLSREQLLREHVGRWLMVRRNWLSQAAKHEARYASTQHILNQINTNC